MSVIWGKRGLSLFSSAMLFCLTACAVPNLDMAKWNTETARYLADPASPKGLVVNVATNEYFTSHSGTTDSDAMIDALDSCNDHYGVGNGVYCEYAFEGNELQNHYIDKYLAPHSYASGVAGLVGNYVGGIGQEIQNNPGALITGAADVYSSYKTGQSAYQQSRDGDDDGTADSSDSDCTPLPPKCSAINGRAMSFNENAAAYLRSARPSYSSADIAYCSNMFTAKVAEVCAPEYRAKGLAHCAAQLDAQKEASLAAAKSAWDNGTLDLASPDLPRYCGWDG